MAFVTAGLLTGAVGLGWLDVPLEGAVAERLTEFALVFLLFSDSARIDLRALAPQPRLAESAAAHRTAA